MLGHMQAIKAGGIRGGRELEPLVEHHRNRPSCFFDMVE
jgi:hypothetical protein